MAVINNLNSTQTPITVGKAGAQAVKWIDCPRVYMKASDAAAAPVVAKSAGVKPTGWTDLGVVQGKAKVTYSKEIKEIRTGLDNVLRASYVGQKTASIEFNLSQFDDVAMEQLSGLTASQVQSASIYQFAVGSEDIIQRALLLVSQNKLDGREWQFYSPNAYMSFTIEDNGEETVLKGTGNLPLFLFPSNGTTEVLFVQSIFA